MKTNAHKLTGAARLADKVAREIYSKPGLNFLPSIFNRSKPKIKKSPVVLNVGEYRPYPSDEPMMIVIHLPSDFAYRAGSFTPSGVNLLGSLSDREK